MPFDAISRSSTSGAQPDASVKGGGAARQGRTVAVIDDDAAVCDSTRVLLEALDFEVHAYLSAAEFFVVDPHVSCVIVDYNMPAMNGIELTAELRKRGNSVPVIMITAMSDPRIETQAAELGIKSVLKKPLGKALVTALQDELG